MQRLHLGDCVVACSAMKPGGLGACPHSKTTLFHAYPNHNYACSIMLCPIEVLVNWVGVQLRMFSCLLFSYRVAQLQLVESFTCWIVLLNWPCSIWSWSTDLKGLCPSVCSFSSVFNFARVKSGKQEYNLVYLSTLRSTGDFSSKHN